MMIDWRAKGFARVPRRVVARGDEIIYRVGGGAKNLVLGSFFSPLKVTSVSEAESRFNLVNWGNRCRYVATYRVKPGVEMWVGTVAHNSNDTFARPGIQIYIDDPMFKVTLLTDIEALRQDLFVSSRAGHS